jgi:hypothetical protein
MGIAWIDRLEDWQDSEADLEMSQRVPIVSSLGERLVDDCLLTRCVRRNLLRDRGQATLHHDHNRTVPVRPRADESRASWHRRSLATFSREFRFGLLKELSRAPMTLSLTTILMVMLAVAVWGFATVVLHFATLSASGDV